MGAAPMAASPPGTGDSFREQQALTCWVCSVCDAPCACAGPAEHASVGNWHGCQAWRVTQSSPLGRHCPMHTSRAGHPSVHQSTSCPFAHPLVHQPTHPPSPIHQPHPPSRTCTGSAQSCWTAKGAKSPAPQPPPPPHHLHHHHHHHHSTTTTPVQAVRGHAGLPGA